MLKIELNPYNTKSIKAALKEVKAYRDNLPRKISELRRRVAKEMADLIDTGFGEAADEDIIEGSVKDEDVVVSVEDGGENVTVVTAKGASAVFQEFGAGVYHNRPVGSSPNPLGPQNLFYIGTFGQGKGARKVWGFYYPKGSKNLVLTHGTPASMPMYHAEQDIIRRIADIARDVFKDGGSM